MQNTIKKYNLNVQEPYLSYILKGIKTVEGRLNKGKFKNMKIEDILNISNTHFKIVGIADYISFYDMVRTEGVKNVIPDKDTAEDAAKVYYKFFTKEQEQNFGVRAIRIKPVK